MTKEKVLPNLKLRVRVSLTVVNVRLLNPKEVNPIAFGVLGLLFILQQLTVLTEALENIVLQKRTVLLVPLYRPPANTKAGANPRLTLCLLIRTIR